MLFSLPRAELARGQAASTNGDKTVQAALMVGVLRRQSKGVDVDKAVLYGVCEPNYKNESVLTLAMLGSRPWEPNQLKDRWCSWFRRT